MKLSKFLLPALLLFAVGCKTIKIEDGRIPTKYLPQAKSLAGTYRGEFNGVPGNLVITFNGNKPDVTYRNSQGTDILNNNCNSRIGNLERVTVKGDRKNHEVSSAVFDFNSVSCALMVRGRDINLGFKQTNKGLRITASILKEIYQREICDWVPGTPPHGPTRQCRWEQQPVYLYGTFYR